MLRKNDLTGKPAILKELNIGLIMDALADHRSATRVELSAVTGISQPTVNVLIAELEKENIVIRIGAAQSTGGRKAEMFALNDKRAYIVSLIAEEKGFSYIVCDMNLNLECQRNVPREEGITFLEQLCRILREIQGIYKKVGAVAVGVPGAVSEEGEVFEVPQIPEWEHVNLKKSLMSEFEFSVIVMNDINAVAYGYARSMRIGARNMVYLHVSESGTGAGIIIDGTLYPGYRSFAGEVAHMLLETDQGAAVSFADMELGRKKLAMTKIVVNIICVLNPERIVIGGSEMAREVCDRIQKECGAYLPKKIMPQFAEIADDTAYYFWGLGETAKELLTQSIRLV